MNHKIYLLYCNKCNWKRHITYETDVADLYEYPNIEIQKNIVEKDPNEEKFRKKIRKFRCPSCGFAINVNIITDLQKNIDSKKELEEKMKKIAELEAQSDNLKKKELDDIASQFNLKENKK